MIAAIKIMHVAGICLWIAGLVALPGLYVRRADIVRNEELYTLQRLVRFTYVTLVSPAAFVAIISGIALIFLQEAYEAWLSVKLLLVALLVVLHLATGMVINRLFEAGEVYSLARSIAVTGYTVALASGVLFLVLSKPPLEFAADGAARRVAQPGWLGETLGPLIPWPIP